MARNGPNHHQSHLLLAIAGLLLSTGGAVLSEPLLAISQRSPNKISNFICVHAYLFFLLPVTFYLSMLLLLYHVTVHAAATEAPLSVLLNKHLPQTAQIVSLANLFLCTPLLVHMSVAEDSVGLAISATLVVIALVAILTSAFKKIIIPACHAGRGFIPPSFALFISTGILISFDLISSFTNKNHQNFLIPIIQSQLLFSSVSFFVFILSITLLLICIRAQADGLQVIIRAENLVISPLCVAIASIVIFWYMKVYMEVTGMGTVPV